LIDADADEEGLHRFAPLLASEPCTCRWPQTLLPLTVSCTEGRILSLLFATLGVIARTGACATAPTWSIPFLLAVARQADGSPAIVSLWWIFSLKPIDKRQDGCPGVVRCAPTTDPNQRAVLHGDDRRLLTEIKKVIGNEHMPQVASILLDFPCIVMIIVGLDPAAGLVAEIDIVATAFLPGSVAGFFPREARIPVIVVELRYRSRL
jgi:hypothetical protein